MKTDTSIKDYCGTCDHDITEIIEDADNKCSAELMCPNCCSLVWRLG